MWSPAVYFHGTKISRVPDHVVRDPIFIAGSIPHRIPNRALYESFLCLLSFSKESRLEADVDAVDFYAVVGADEDVLDSVDDAGLYQVAVFGLDPDGDVGGPDGHLSGVD